MAQYKDLTKLTVENQVLRARARVHEKFERFWDSQSEGHFYRFQESLINFYQVIRVYINKENNKDLIEDLDKELLKGSKGHQFNLDQEKVEKWAHYYFELEQALFEEGVTDISQPISFSPLKSS